MDKIYQFTDKFHELQVKSSQLSWTLFTTGYDFGIEEIYQKMMDLLKDEEIFEHVKSCQETVKDSKEKRELEIVYNLLKPYHLSEEASELQLKIQNKVKDLSKILNTFRYTFQGRQVSSVELDQVLSMDDNRERRKEAFFAKNQINQPMIDGGFIDLIKMRKDYAKMMGHENFVSYMLEENELEKDMFDTWIGEFHELLPKVKALREQYAKEFLNDDKIMPWDERYITSKIAPSLNKTVDMSEYYENIRKLFEMFNIDITRYNITYDIFPRINKSEWGYNFPIDTAKDTRILANVKNKFDEYGVFLHETGHAVHSYLKDPNEKILNMGVSGIISEGIANLFGSFLYKEIFFGQFFSDKETVSKEFKKLLEYGRLNSLRALNNIFFDHNLYKEDIESLDDIHNVYWKTYKHVFKEEPYGENPPWAFRIHHTTHPIYLHNYFMGDVTCEMLEKVFKEKYNAEIIEEPEKFGEFLINEVVKPSGLYKYNELFRRISGDDFSLKYMID